MTTPARPRQSGIPGPGRTSGIPTPGRSRSSSTVHQTNYTTAPDDISRAFADAIKANDPSQHRILPSSNNASTATLSPQSAAHSLSSGRRSVAGRPSSAASSSSTKVHERAKTPTSSRISSRPPSRQQSEGLGKAMRGFEVGDNVRIESLGFEGTLRFIGEIDGKLGLWAGVELSGGFSGRGKNDGTVNGKQYFSCPDKCGVFVATAKLSAPTVGPGVIQRPSSVASSRGGRTTPAISGRTTPSTLTTSRTPSASFSTNGRATPSAGGRMTPSLAGGRVTPSSNLTGSFLQRPFKTPISKTNNISLSEKITAGSRASKYMSMTAQQLSSRDRDPGDDSPPPKSGDRASLSIASPTASRNLSSPTRPPGSPFSTPKAAGVRTSNITGSPSLSLTRGRVSQNTPRARVSSSVAMPPPPSPKPPHIQPIRFPEASAAHILDKSKNIQDKGIADGSTGSSSRPGSSVSIRSTGNDELSILEQLQSRLDAAEYENERLRAAPDTEVGVLSSVQLEQLERLQKERQDALDRTSYLEAKLSPLESRLATSLADLDNLRTSHQSLTLQLEEKNSEVQRLAATYQSDLQSQTREKQVLKEKIDELDRSRHQKDETNEAQASIIKELECNLEKILAEIEDERQDLNAQIDELRVAGQETIALYEERLSAANSQRYELESRISSLEANLKSLAVADRSQESSVHLASSATQIDNETLRDQVQHLQKKSVKLEEQLEDTRATLERDVSTYQDKISRLRLEEEQRKRDLALKTKEVEQLLKSERNARNRVEEVEEALRESTVALENARGEVEVLRAELTNLDILIDDSSEGDISSKLASFTKRASADRAKYQQEIGRLEQILQDARSENNILLEKSLQPASLAETKDTQRENIILRDKIHLLEKKVSELTQTLEDRTSESEGTRKKLNRDASVLNGGLESSRSNSSKPELSTVREEVAGLKHIVQELQKENLASAQQIKLLESENRLLSTEAEQLRQEVHILEDNLDSSPGEGTAGTERDTWPSQLADQNVRFENELDQMRKRFSEAEMKHARTVHGLHKEISELEALVESKIYREDELEQEVERLKDKLTRHKKSSKTGNEIPDGRHRLSIASTSTASSESATACEICERPGHDIFNCSLLKDDKEVICEDCESPGHDAANCPHSQDVF